MAIDFSKMTKEQKQYILLGGMFAVIFIVVLYTLLGSGGSGDSKASVDVDKSMEELQDEYDTLERQVRKEKRINQDFEETVEQLAQIKGSYLPDKLNKYSWVTERIYSEARDEQIQVELVTEIRRVTNADWPFSTYAVQLDMIADYERLVRYIADMSAKNPYMRVTTLNIRADNEDPHRHHITLTLEWPTNLKTVQPPKKTEEGKNGPPTPM